MMRFLRNMSLRLKITVVLILIVVGGTVVSTAIGSRIVTEAMLAEAKARVRTGLATAERIYAFRLSQVCRAVSRCSRSARLSRGTGLDAPGSFSAPLESLRKENSLDFLGVIDGQDTQVTSLGRAVRKVRPKVLAQIMRAVRHGNYMGSTEVFEREALLQEGKGLADRARISIGVAPKTALERGDPLDRGLVLLHVEPIPAGRGIVGVIYGGVLLNRSTALVEQVREGVFGDDSCSTCPGGRIGMAAILLGDVQVSNDTKMREGRTQSARAAPDVAKAVLDGDQRWVGRTRVGNTWFVTAYRPIHNHRKKVVGMLQVGVQEARYLEVRTKMMVSFLIVAAIGVLIVLGLIYVIARTMTRPLEEMVAATKKIADGELDYSVHVATGDEIGGLAIAFNAMVGSLKRARRELEQSAETLEQKVVERTEKLKQVQSRMAQSEKMASLGRMAAGVAHEINNPLGGILTFSALGQQDLPDDHPQHHHFEIIYQQTLRCREIVKGLLEFSRSADAKPELTSLNSTVEKTLLLLKRQTIFHDICAISTLEAGLPDLLMNPGQLQEVVLNLIINAVDAMEGNGQLDVRTGQDSESEEIIIEVRDTGKGIPAELLGMIFEPFFTTKAVGQGTGLGLAIVHGIVTQAGGKIEVETSPQGSRFIVRFPMVSRGQIDEGDKEDESSKTSRAGHHRLS